MAGLQSLTAAPHRCGLLIALLVLGACSSHPPRMRGGPDGVLAQPLAEKTVIRALNEIEASEQQRRDILAAFDRDTADRRRLEAESGGLRQQLDSLSDTQPDYLAQIEPLAQRRGQLLTEQILIRARFDHAVATSLSPEQLDRWTLAVRELSLDGSSFGPGGSGRRRGGMGGGFGAEPF